MSTLSDFAGESLYDAQNGKKRLKKAHKIRIELFLSLFYCKS